MSISTSLPKSETDSNCHKHDHGTWLFSPWAAPPRKLKEQFWKDSSYHISDIVIVSNGEDTECLAQLVRGDDVYRDQSVRSFLSDVSQNLRVMRFTAPYLYDNRDGR